MRRLRYNSAALRDLASIVEYVSERASSAIANRLAHGIRARCRELASLPGTLGRPRPEVEEGVRSVAHGNYVIFFRYESDAFRIINVLHGHGDIDALFHGDEPGR